MKRRLLTKKDIQRDLLKQLSALKAVSIFLTVLIMIAVALYSINLVSYLNGMPVDYEGLRSPNLTPGQAMLFMPVLIVLFTFIVIYIYYFDLYKIKRGQFEIIEDELCQKEKALVRYYRGVREENMLCFRDGKVTVDNEVYTYAREGDRFYVVVLHSKLRSKRAPRLAYHKMHYDISKTEL